MAIQHKDCPRCATTVATYISHCGCGYSFDRADDIEPTQRLEALVEQEKLYEDYLTARLLQATAEATDAKARAQDGPDNYHFTARAESAISARQAVLVELYQQKLRVAELLEDIEAAKATKVHTLNPPVHKTQQLRRAMAMVVPVAAVRPRSEKKTVATPRVSAAKTERPTVTPLPVETNIAAPVAVTSDTPIPPTAPARPVIPESTTVTALAKSNGNGAYAAGTVVSDIQVPTVQPIALEPPTVIALSPDIAPVKSDENSAYAAKLKGILSYSLRTEPPSHAAERGAVTSIGAAVTAAVRAPAAPTSRAIAAPVLRPEEQLEQDSRAIRVRATEMVARLSAPPANTRPIETSAAASRAAPILNDKSASIRPAADTAATVKTAPQTTPKITPALNVQSLPANAKRPSRTTRTQRAKQEQHLPVAKTAASQPPAMPMPPPEPYMDDRPSAVFRAEQAAKAEKIVRSAKAAKRQGPKHCPFCSAKHGADTERCGCGYIFEGPIDLPVLVLSSKERAELFEEGIHIERPKLPG